MRTHTFTLSSTQEGALPLILDHYLFFDPVYGANFTYPSSAWGRYFLNTSTLTGFSVTTTSGNILVDWGDGTSDSLNSNVPVDHTFYCPDYSAPQSDFWNNIDPCVL